MPSRMPPFRQRLGVEYALGALDQITQPLVSRAGTGSPVDQETARILRWAISYYDRIPSDLRRGRDGARRPVAKAYRQAGILPHGPA